MADSSKVYYSSLIDDNKENPEEQNSVANGGENVDEKLKLPLGYRFIPTDCELVLKYLVNKILGQPQPANIITESIDLYKFDPEWLPISEFLYGKEKEAYFFTHTRERFSRSTESGYWKDDGDEVNIFCDKVIVGFKKILVFYRKKASLEEKTGWTIHEYRANPTLIQAPKLDGMDCAEQYVVCRIRYKDDDAKESEQTSVI